MFLGILFFSTALLCSSSSFFAWFYLVSLTIIGLYYLSSSLPTTVLTIYFVISVASTLLFLSSAIFSPHFPFLASLALFAKLGLPPFHWWAFYILSFLSGRSLFFFLCLLKVGPLWYVMLNAPFSLVLCTASSLVGLTLLFSSSNIGVLLLSSSFIQPLLLSFIPCFFLLSFSVVYYLCVLVCCSYADLSISPYLGLWILLGLPPLGMFCSKLLFLSYSPFLPSLLLLTTSAFVIIPYVSLSFSFVFSGITSITSLFTITLLCWFPLLFIF